MSCHHDTGSEVGATSVHAGVCLDRSAHYGNTGGRSLKHVMSP